VGFSPRAPWGSRSSNIQAGFPPGGLPDIRYSDGWVHRFPARRGPTGRPAHRPTGLVGPAVHRLPPPRHRYVRCCLADP
jgi:hypothetical protein